MNEYLVLTFPPSFPSSCLLPFHLLSFLVPSLPPFLLLSLPAIFSYSLSLYPGTKTKYAKTHFQGARLAQTPVSKQSELYPEHCSERTHGAENIGPAQPRAWKGIPEEEALALDLGRCRIHGSAPGRGTRDPAGRGQISRKDSCGLASRARAWD